MVRWGGGYVAHPRLSRFFVVVADAVMQAAAHKACVAFGTACSPVRRCRPVARHSVLALPIRHGARLREGQHSFITAGTWLTLGIEYEWRVAPAAGGAFGKARIVAGRGQEGNYQSGDCANATRFVRTARTFGKGCAGGGGN